MLLCFQAEDGIRDYKVTGVQTCALPISADVLGIGITGKTLTDLERRILRGSTPYAVVLFGRNIADAAQLRELVREVDRKSTRLNSSHLVISYAVFCLKKKNR